ncbi:hypothetical protein D3C71_1456720 [compost metagenome]
MDGDWMNPIMKIGILERIAPMKGTKFITTAITVNNNAYCSPIIRKPIYIRTPSARLTNTRPTMNPLNALSISLIIVVPSPRYFFGKKLTILRPNFPPSLSM